MSRQPLSIEDEVYELRRVVRQLSKNVVSVREEAREVNVSEILGSIFPVGSVFVSGSDQLPPLIAGLGSWQRLEGRVIVGVQESVSEFDTVDKTGGARTHTLTAAQLPPHRHSIRREWGTASNLGVAAPGQYNQISNSGAFDNYMTRNDGGSGQAHNNLQPYKTKYMWERIS